MASRHHCSRISPGSASRMRSRTRGDLGIEGIERKQRGRACPRAHRARRDSGRGRRRAPRPSHGFEPASRRHVSRRRSARRRRRGPPPAGRCRSAPPPRSTSDRRQYGPRLQRGRAAAWAIGRSSLPLPISRISILPASANSRAKSVRRQRQRIRRLPAIDAGRQAQQRAAMRHVGEAEAAIAIGLDRRTAGEMRRADDDAFGHSCRQVASALPRRPRGFSPSRRRRLPGRSWNRISSGAAMKIDE